MAELYNKKELNEMHNKLLDILKWFHAFCVENNLRYYALGGTMLGAKRHEGFIPWDDDIDVGMPRKDYKKFISLCKGKKFGKYIIETVTTKHLDYYYGYVKIYDTSTTLIEKTRTNIKRGIYIDLFPLDGAGDSMEEALKIFKPISNSYSLLVARTCAILPRRKWYKNAVVVISRLIPNFIVNNKKLLLKIDHMCQKKAFDDSKFIGNFLGNWGAKEIMKREIMGEPTVYKFEDTVIYGSERADEYLTSLYGDWRQLPPVEKRVSLHDSVSLDLHKSYLRKK